MSGYTAKSIDDLPSLWDGFAKLVRPGLGVTAFGANIMDLPPDYSTNSHNESESVSRSSTSRCAALALSISASSAWRSTPSTSSGSAGTDRVLTSGQDGLRVLFIGGIPGGVYEPPEWSSSGE